MEPSAEFVAETKRRAAAGEASAQSNLGLFYSYGKGVPCDMATSVKWYKLAAEQGLAQAQYNLGIAYDQGNGVTRSLEEAFRWFARAANQGHSGAQFNAAICLIRGEGVDQDEIEGFKWILLAARQGHDDASSVQRDIQGKAADWAVRGATDRANAWKPVAELPIEQQLGPGFYIDR